MLLAVWMTFIFIMSSHQADKSSQLSGGIVFKLITVFFSDFGDLSKENQNEIVDIVTFIVRKTAHFLEFFVLGVLAWFTVVTYNFGYKRKIFFAFAFCVLYAASDELHQLLVPGRAGRFTDVCIDTAGSTAAIVFCMLFMYFYKKRRLGECNAKKEVD